MDKGKEEYTPRAGVMSRALLSVAILCAFAALIFCAISFTPGDAFAEEKNEINAQQLPDSSFIYDMSIVDIATADPYYDNQTVQVVGEAVGDSLLAGAQNGHRWITLLSQDADSNASVSIYISAADAEKIDSFGKYGSTGSMLRVQGEYHLACAEHEGLSDIHAEQVSVVSAGKKTSDNFDFAAFIPGAVAIGVGLVLVAVYSYLREKRR